MPLHLLLLLQLLQLQQNLLLLALLWLLLLLLLLWLLLLPLLLLLLMPLHLLFLQLLLLLLLPLLLLLLLLQEQCTPLLHLSRVDQVFVCSKVCGALPAASRADFGVEFLGCGLRVWYAAIKAEARGWEGCLCEQESVKSEK